MRWGAKSRDKQKTWGSIGKTQTVGSAAIKFNRAPPAQWPVAGQDSLLNAVQVCRCDSSYQFNSDQVILVRTCSLWCSCLSWFLKGRMGRTQRLDFERSSDLFARGNVFLARSQLLSVPAVEGVANIVLRSLDGGPFSQAECCAAILVVDVSHFLAARATRTTS